MRRKLLFAAIVLAVMLVGLELASRVALLAIPERPSPTDEPFPTFAAKPAGTLRVLTFGESTVAGFPYPALGFVEQLRFRLGHAAPDRAVELTNLAVGGLNSSDVLRRVRQALRKAQPDVLVVMVGHNEFLDRQVGGRLDLALERAEALGMVRLLRRLMPARAGARGGGYFLPERLYPLSPEDGAWRRRVARYRHNVAAIAAAARAAGVPLYLCTLPSNLREWPPAYQKVAWAWVDDGAEGAASYERQARAALAALAGGDLASARGACAQFDPPHSGDALLTYLHARLADLEGASKEQVSAALRRARDLDPIPWRVLSAFNDFVREQAGEGVRVVDVEQAFEQFGGRAPGFELVADNCHPTPQGHALIAGLLLRQLAADGLLGESLRAQALPSAAGPDDPFGSEPGPFMAWFEAQSEHAGYAPMLAILNALYCMKPPFFNYDAARGYLAQAGAAQPGNWRVPANLGSIALLLGDVPTARAELERAVALYGGPLPLEERGSIPYLKEALAGAPQEIQRICELGAPAAFGADGPGASP